MAQELIIITAIGSQDRPGIIASLTGTILDEGGNLDDATMTRLHGAFATMIAAKIDNEKIKSLKNSLSILAAKLDLHISTDLISPKNQESVDIPDHIITVYGADHPGIVHNVAKLLQSAGANITDLKTRLTGDSTPNEALYVMMIETSGGDWTTLPDLLKKFGDEQSVVVSYSILDEETL